MIPSNIKIDIFSNPNTWTVMVSEASGLITNGTIFLILRDFPLENLLGMVSLTIINTPSEKGIEKQIEVRLNSILLGEGRQRRGTN